ncbi:hypothetical protein ACFQV8_23160 [Pseudonocardia benzenivorans]
MGTNVSVTAALPVARHAVGLAVKTAGVPGAVAVTSFVVPGLGAAYGWQPVLLWSVPVVVAVGVLAAAVLPDARGRITPALDTTTADDPPPPPPTCTNGTLAQPRCTNGTFVQTAGAGSRPGSGGSRSPRRCSSGARRRSTRGPSRSCTRARGRPCRSPGY